MQISNSISIWNNNFASIGAAGGLTNEYSVLFDGIDEFGSNAAFTTYGGANKVSLSCWVKFTSIGGNAPVVNYTDGLQSNFRFGIQKNTSNQLLLLCGNGGPTYWVSTETVTNNVWYHILMVFDGTEAAQDDRVRGWLDGTALTLTRNGAAPTTLAAGMDTLRIARNQSATYGDLNIDEPAFFTGVLDGTDATSLSAAPIDLSTYSTIPDHWYRMGDGDTHPTLTDNIGSLDITLTNTEAGDIVADVPS